MKLGANLYDPESVKETIARQEKWSEGRKSVVVYAYALFASWLGIRWTPPMYKPVQKLPFIPTEKEIDDLIAGCGKRVSAFLQLLKETGMRAGEAFHLKWTDLDPINNTVRVTPEKRSNPRVFRVSGKLIAMLNNLPRISERIFGYKSMNSLRRTFWRQRKTIAHKLENPRILQIHFHTFRHWKATMEYARTKDILHVMKLLGHKRIQNTLTYTQLVDFKEDEFVCRIANCVEEAKQLIECGFDYVCEIDGFKLFRKRK